MKKVILSLAAVAMLVTVGSALEIKGAITKKAMAVTVEKAPVKDSTVNVNHSVITNSSYVDHSAVAGNTGVQVKGKKVDIKGSHLKNRSTIQNSAVAGNTGIKVKAEKVNIKNSHIHNSSRIKNSAVAGNTGVELGN